ncbi:MAG: type IV toxin-antitoxin system AbiEi family antitoxin [Flavobacteriales bacterium]
MNKKEKIETTQVLYEALNQVQPILGPDWKITLRPNKKVYGDDQVVLLYKGDEVYRADRIVQTHFRDEHIARNYNQIKNNKTIIIAEYILPKTKTLLRQQEIDYLDINGNCHIKEAKKKEKVFFFIEGQKNKEYKKEKYSRPFAKAGLKVIYEFLLDKNFINHTYRDIAGKAGVALGNINHIVNGLLEEGFILRKNKNELTLIKTDELLDKWTAAYGERLKPTLEIGTFRFMNPNDFDHWHTMPFDPEKTCWGGEPAAYFLTKYLNPQVLTMYTTENKVDLIKKYKLVPDPYGNVKIYRKFWGEKEKTKDPVVHPLLVYTDLILTNDERCLETANMIYEKHLKENI